MKNFPTLKQYLHVQGYKKQSPKHLLDEAKKEHRRLYLKEYRKRRRGSERQLTIRLTEEEYTLLLNNKETHESKSLSRSIVSFAVAYIGKKYLPRSEKKQKKLVQGITKIGSNINQVVNKLHRQMQIKTMQGIWDDSISTLTKILVGYEMVVEQVEALEASIREYVKSPPPDLLGLEWEIVKTDKAKLKSLITFLLKHLESLKS